MNIFAIACPYSRSSLIKLALYGEQILGLY
jgi:hypothetical protein